MGTSDTVTREDASYVDAFGITIHYYVWSAPEPKAIIQLAHGLGDHALRYDWVARRLVDAGYTVYADDHRGHGETGREQHAGDLAKLGRLGPGGMRATLAAMRQFTGIIRERHPLKPLVLIGHSWGSIIAQLLVNTASADYDAVVLTGTAYRTLTRMNGGDLAKRHRVPGGTGYEWLSRDPAVAEAFRDDPLTFDAKTLPLFGLRDSLRLLGRPARTIERDLPLLIQIGSDDTLGGTRSAELLARSYLVRGRLSDVELIVYTDARHEVFNETNRDEVIADTISWIGSRVA